MTNFDGRSYSYQGPYLGHLAIGHRDTAVGPVSYEVETAKPAKHGRKTMDFDGASGVRSEILRALRIDCVRIRNVEGAVESAVISLRVDQVLAFGCSMVAASFFRAAAASAECHFVGLQYLASPHQDHRMLRFNDYYPVRGLCERRFRTPACRGT